MCCARACVSDCVGVCDIECVCVRVWVRLELKEEGATGAQKKEKGEARARASYRQAPRRDCVPPTGTKPDTEGLRDEKTAPGARMSQQRGERQPEPFFPPQRPCTAVNVARVLSVRRRRGVQTAGRKREGEGGGSGKGAIWLTGVCVCVCVCE